MEKKFEMFQVYFSIEALDEDFIKICITKGKVSSYVVDKTLKRLRGISQAKSHSGVFKMPEWGSKGGLGDISRVYGYLMVRFDKVNFGKRF